LLVPASVGADFGPGPTDPYHLFLMLKELKGMLS